MYFYVPAICMTPMTGGIATAEKDRHITLPRLSKGGKTPGVPVDGIVGMTVQIGRGGLF